MGESLVKKGQNRSNCRHASDNNPSKNREPYWLSKVSFVVLLAVLLIWSWQKLTSPKMLPIRSIEIQGHLTHVSQQTLRQAILPFMQAGFWRLDKDGLRDRLLHLPWIATVKIHRTWPDVLKIYLAEQVPVAQFNNMPINQQGEFFDFNKVKLSNLPMLTGPTGQQKPILQMYEAMSRLLAPLSLRITQLMCDSQQHWQIKLNDSFVVFIGRADTLHRLERFAKIYPLVIANKSSFIDYIDLRYQHGMTVHFKNNKYFPLQ